MNACQTILNKEEYHYYYRPHISPLKSSMCLYKVYRFRTGTLESMSISNRNLRKYVIFEPEPHKARLFRTETYRNYYVIHVVFEPEHYEVCRFRT